MIRTLTLALILVGLLHCAGYASENAITIGEPRIVIPAPENERFAHLSWPKIVTAPDGTLVTAYIAGRKHVNGDGCPAVSVSRDHGKTFSKPKILREFDKTMRYQHGANLALGVAEDGALVLMVMAFTNDERNSIFGWRSEDSGETWIPTDTTSLADSKTGSVFGYVFPVPGKGLAVCGHFRKPKGDGIWIAFSKDHGKSWGAPETITGNRYFEPTFLFSEGKLIGLIRENSARAYHQYVSSDLGKSWEATEKALQGNPSATHPSPFLIEDPAHPGQLYALQSERGKDNRIHLWKTTAAKLDWKPVAQVVEVPNDRDFSYPWMTPLGNGKWFLVYYSGEKDGPNSIWGLEMTLP
ncbi:MAG: sialidase family protein [Verrucomicrobiales bacterium]|nr:sialidase family protein [Verrucomicrobiales bacterium]